MSKERFLETFGRLALTLRLPFMRNIIENPEILRDDGSGGEAKEHPLLRIARSKYSPGSIEERLVLRFMNDHIIAEGIREENHFANTRWLARLVRHARCWAEELLERDPETVNAMFKESTEESIESARVLLRQELGPDPADVDDASAAEALMEWANPRGLESSENRVGLWQLVVDSGRRCALGRVAVPKDQGLNCVYRWITRLRGYCTLRQLWLLLDGVFAGSSLAALIYRYLATVPPISRRNAS